MYKFYISKLGVPKRLYRKIWLIMRLTTIILIASLIQVSAATFAQRITLNQRNTPLESVFKEIRKQSGYDFFYDGKAIKPNQRVSISVTDVSVEDALKSVLKDLPFTYEISDNRVTIRKKEVPTFFDNVKAAFAVIDVHGRVVDEKGQPLPGVTIKTKDSKVSTISNQKGEFTLKNTNPDITIVLTFIGYNAIELLAKEDLGDIKLSLATSKLDEVVIQAYGATSQRSSTGDIGTVKGSDIEKQPVDNPLLALQGRIPGVFITQQTGVPGGAISITIRGQNSIDNGNEPLYVVDGVPYPSELLPNIGGGTLLATNNNATGNPLNYLNMSNIQRIDILKDADATAIYGSRGANGVVLITTKKGNIGPVKTDINFSQGIGKIDREAKLLNTTEYLDIRHQAFNNDNKSPGIFDFDLNGKWDTTRYTNWQKDLIGNIAKYTNAQLTFSGGTVNTQYLVGGIFNRETTVFPGDYANTKGGINFNLNTTSDNQKLKLTISANYLSNNNNLPAEDFTKYIVLAPVAPPAYNSDGTLNWMNVGSFNPYAGLYNKLKDQANNLIGNATLSYNILKGLDVKASAGYNYLITNQVSTTSIASFNPAYNITSGNSVFAEGKIRTLIFQPQVNYQVIFGKSTLQSLVGLEYQNNSTNSQIINGNGYTNDALLESLAAAADITKGNISDAQYKYASLFSRISYNWDGKYLVNLSGRRDGSSRFGPDRRFANFGAVGLGWVFTKEQFFKNVLSFIDFGKLRASYGTSGNDAIGDYKYLELYDFYTNAYSGSQGVNPRGPSIPDYAWEVNKKQEIGIELAFLKERINLNVSVYNNRSSNQLVGYDLPDITGTGSITKNLPATVQNSGLEISINASVIKGSSFSWTTAFNITSERNKLIAFPDFENSSFSYRYVIGQPLNIIKTYHFLGVNKATGLYQIADKNGNATTNPTSDDQTSLVNLAPSYYGGLQNSFAYRNFSIDFFFQFVKQKGRSSVFSNSLPPGFARIHNPLTESLQRWQKPGDDAPYEKFTQSTSSDAFKAYQLTQQSDYAYTDASFIRLKNLSVSYQLPHDMISKWHVQNLRIFLQGQNLLTLTKYLGVDPENQSLTSLPPIKVFTTGVQVTF